MIKDNSTSLPVIVEKAILLIQHLLSQPLKATVEVTGQEVEKVTLMELIKVLQMIRLCENIDVVFTGIQGFESRYDLEMTPGGLLVTDTKTGEQTKAVLCKKLINSKEDRWRIPTSSGFYYFGQLAIRASHLRRILKKRTEEELHTRNNVEATIFQLGIPLRNNKSKYRGLIKQKIWTYCRCLWINLVRILNYMKQICQRTFKAMDLSAQPPFFAGYLTSQIGVQPILSRTFSIASFISVIINFYVFL